MRCLFVALILPACIDSTPVHEHPFANEPVELDARCVAFARDFCGAWQPHLPAQGYALGTVDDAPLQVDDVEACVEQLVDGWHYTSGELRVLGKCDEPFDVDAGGCMRALASVGSPATVDAVNKMLLVCSRGAR